MTVFTTLPSSEKENEAKEKCGGKIVDAFPKKPTVAWTETESPKFPQRVGMWLDEKPYRAKALRAFCILNTIGLILLIILLVGTVVVQVRRHQRHRRGWTCGIDYMDDRRTQRNNQLGRLSEHIAIDDNEEWETINVLNADSMTWFVHDFKNDLTAVVDTQKGLCFVKPIDRTRVPPPSQTLVMLEDHESPFYRSTSRIVRETYRVSKVESIAVDSPIIRSFCQDKTMFMLRKLDMSSDFMGDFDVEPTNRLSVQQTKRRLHMQRVQQRLGPRNELDRFSSQRWRRNTDDSNCTPYSAQHDAGTVLEMNICL